MSMRKDTIGPLYIKQSDSNSTTAVRFILGLLIQIGEIVQGQSDIITLLRNGDNPNTTVAILECSFITDYFLHS